MCGLLLFGYQCSVDIDAMGIGQFAELLADLQACHLGDVFAMNTVGVAHVATAKVQGLSLGFLSLLVSDESIGQHPINHILLTSFGTFGVAKRVVCRRGFGNSGQHRGFGQGQFIEWFAKIRERCCSKTKCPIAQKDLVEIDL